MILGMLIVAVGAALAGVAAAGLLREGEVPGWVPVAIAVGALAVLALVLTEWWLRR